MKVRLGYVAIALNCEGVTTSSPVTYKRYCALETKEEQLSLLSRVARSNLEGLIHVLTYNIQEDIHFYRMTSKLIPLATHTDVLWDYEPVIKEQCQTVAQLLRTSKMRVDAHPDQFNVLNSATPSVVHSTIETLNHQLDLFRLFEIDNPKMVLHVGGKTGGKEEALQRFRDHFLNCSRAIQQAIILENDDKVYSAQDVLMLCEELKIPMVLDVHHHRCYNEGCTLAPLLPRIFNTWKDESVLPKLHFSTPKEGTFDRRHADYINADDFISFIEEAKGVGQDFDMMLEAKMKDLALEALVRDIKQKRPEWIWHDKTTFEC